METEVSQWLSSIPCGLNLSKFANDLAEREFSTKNYLKYLYGSDLEVCLPSPRKLSYSKKKILSYVRLKSCQRVTPLKNHVLHMSNHMSRKLMQNMSIPSCSKERLSMTNWRPDVKKHAQNGTTLGITKGIVKTIRFALESLVVISEVN